MRALIAPLLLGSASMACALAGVGVALHGTAAAALPAALLYGGFGAAAGLVCTLLQHAHHRLPVHEAPTPDGPGEAPAAVLARTMLAELSQASAASARQPRAALSSQEPAPAVAAAAAARPEPSSFGA